MTNKITQAITDTHEYQQNSVKELIKQTFTLAALRTKLIALESQLSDTVDVNLYGTSYWFTVTSREDLVVLLTLAPTWKKSNGSLGIDYNAEVDGAQIFVKTRDEALPPTCRVVKKTITVPEHTEERSFVECDNASEVVEGSPEAVLEKVSTT